MLFDIVMIASKTDVIICAAEDSGEAEKLRTELLKNGYAPVMEVYGVIPFDDLDERVSDALERAGIVIVLWFDNGTAWSVIPYSYPRGLYFLGGPGHGESKRLVLALHRQNGAAEVQFLPFTLLGRAFFETDWQAQLIKLFDNPPFSERLVFGPPRVRKQNFIARVRPHRVDGQDDPFGLEDPTSNRPSAAPPVDYDPMCPPSPSMLPSASQPSGPRASEPIAFEALIGDLDDLTTVSPHTPPAPPAAAAKLKTSSASTGIGSILWTMPDRMQVSKRERVEVRLGDASVVETQLHIGIKGRGLPQIDRVKIGRLMRVTLVGDAKDFTIQSLSTIDQYIQEAEVAQWDFDVTPLRSGSRTLRILVSIRVKVEGKDEVIDLPSYEREVHIGVAPLHTAAGFISRNWQWAAGSIVIPLAIWSFAHTDVGAEIAKRLGVHF